MLLVTSCCCCGRSASNNGGLTAHKQTSLALGIAHGLDFIHKAGVLHQDIKPDNVLIVGDIPKLADFGLADLLIPGQDGRRPRMKEVGGTLAWSAPEMLAVRARRDCGGAEIDEKLDIFAFACLVDWLQWYSQHASDEHFSTPRYMAPYGKQLQDYYAFADLSPEVQARTQVPESFTTLVCAFR
jgi:serine/threonine protein kinase